MEKALGFSLILSMLVVGGMASCALMKEYDTKIIPACEGTDLHVKWPNYEDPSSYYVCVSTNKAELKQCPSNEYFVYVKQTCSNCAYYIPAVPCELLKVSNAPNDCVPIEK